MPETKGLVADDKSFLQRHGHPELVLMWRQFSIPMFESLELCNENNNFI